MDVGSRMEAFDKVITVRLFFLFLAILKYGFLFSQTD